MTPTELRRMAERCRDNSVAHNAAIWRGCSPHEWEWSQEQQEEMARYCLEASHCVDHVLSTVREDDGEAITPEWIESIGWTKIDRPAVYIDQSGAVEYQSWANTICCRGWGRPHVQTRGQLRRLLEGLGVGQ